MKTKNITPLLLPLFLLACHPQNGQYQASGAFEATEITVSAQAAGTITQLLITEGQTLEKGQNLGAIDTTQLHLKKAQLQASIQAAQTRLQNIPLLTDPLRQQLEQQQTEAHRFQALLQADAAPQKQVDDLQASIRILQKQLQAQTHTLRQTNQTLAAEIQTLQIQIQQIDDLIAKSLITAPIAGTILAQYAHAGELAPLGRPLFKIADLQNITLRAYITADQLNHLQLNQQLPVYVDFDKNQPRRYTGTLAWISPKAEFTPKTILTKNERANLVYAVKISLQNDGYLKIGMYGEVRL
jgi:HlyD family secretion protein